MITRKYAKDFEIEYDITPSGRRKARAVYKGKYYIFTDTGEKIRRTAIYFAVLLAAGWLAFLIPLFILSEASRTFYVSLPHVCVFLPLVGMTAVTVDLWTVRQPFIRERRDRISKRAVVSVLFMVLFSGAAAAGLVILLFSSPDTILPGDLVFILCEALLLAVSILLFAGRGRTKTQEAG